MAAIPLANGKGVALVDESDLPLIAVIKWHVHPQGYASGYLGHRPDRRLVLMHRLVMGEPNGATIDHINHDKLDNRRANLRLATREQQIWNSKLMIRNTSGFKGVDFKATQRGNRKWRARIQGEFLGFFLNAEAAALAYDSIARVRFGEFAFLNFPSEADQWQG